MVEPFLNLMGRANEAMEFYETVFKCSDKKIVRVSDMPSEPAYPLPSEMRNLIAHAQMTIHGTRFNFSDMQPGVISNNMISLKVVFSSPEEINDVYAKLSDGGEVRMELSEQSYARLFAWVRDKFGVDWQLVFE